MSGALFTLDDSDSDKKTEQVKEPEYEESKPINTFLETDAKTMQIDTNQISIIEQYKSINDDPTRNNSEFLRKACLSGLLDFVDYLLLNTTSDPTAKNNEPLLYAVTGNHLNVVKRLLHDSRVDINVLEGKLFTIACSKGYYDMVELFLDYNNNCFCDSDNCDFNNLHCVSYMYPKIDPTLNNNEALQFATANQHVNIVALLLNDHRISPSCRKNMVLYWACRNGHSDILYKVLQDKRVKQNMNLHKCYKEAASKDRENIINILDIFFGDN